MVQNYLKLHPFFFLGDLFYYTYLVQVQIWPHFFFKMGVILGDVPVLLVGGKGGLVTGKKVFFFV